MTAGEWQAGVLELLEDPWERGEARDAVAAIRWDNPAVSLLELVTLVAANVARVHYDDAGESEGMWADKLRAAGDVWYYRDDTTTGEMLAVAAVLVELEGGSLAGLVAAV